MNSTRRNFLARGSAVLAALGLPAHALGHVARQEEPADASQTNSEDPPKTLLILGGTSFLGPAVVAAARARGFEITLFNRGKTAPEMFSDLEQLRGDRDPDKDAGLSALEGDRTWDYVLDTSSYVPRQTRAVAKLLSDRVGRYCLISTVSVYPDLSRAGLDETGEVGRLDDPNIEEVNNTTYGPLKALCEEAAEAALPGRVVNLRPGLIVGPRDRTGRFGYWPVRVREGGEVLAPGNPSDPVQFIDARDLAEFALHCLTQDHMGLYNVVGPSYGATIADLVHGCRAVTTSGATFRWVSAERCAELGLRAWGELPVWSSPTGDSAGINSVSAERAKAVGLGSRPLAETARDYLEWYDTLTPEQQERYRGGMSKKQEAEALA